MSIYEDYKFYKANEYTPKQKLHLIAKRGKQCDIYEDFISLDTETSWNHELENPVGWIYQFAFLLKNDIVYGRNPFDFIKALKEIKNVYGINKEKKMIIYVHNLPYDWQYLKNFLIKEFGKDYNLLASSAHKVFSFEIAGFVFKCSYKLSNKSLYKWAKDLNVKHKKLIDVVDYQAIRNQNTRLTKNDWKYQFYDIICLKECVEKQMKIYNDNLRSIPLTSTSYIRRVARKFYKEKDSYLKNYHDFKKTALDENVYKMLLNESAGGISHGNFKMAGKRINAKIGHYDFRSHYPSQMRVADFPVGKFELFFKYDKDKKKKLCLADFKKLTKDYCYIANVIIRNIKIKKGVTMPYLQVAKVMQQQLEKSKIISDNGRVLEYKGACLLSVNEIDMKWIEKQYTFEIFIDKVYISKKGKLPDFLIKTVDFFFKGKTEYKKVVKDYKKKYENNEISLDLLLDAEINLMKSKSGINGIFGCTFTKPVRDDFYMDEKGKWHKGSIIEHDDGTIEHKKIDINKALEEYYDNRNNFMRFQFGCWVTANARDELMTIIELIGYENFIYCDTDSIYCILTKDTQEIINNFNKENNKKAEELKAYITINNKKVYYNVLEDEEDIIESFKFLHAKCYGMIINNKKEVITKDNEYKHMEVIIAGVTRFSKNKKISREKELRYLDNLNKGYKFVKCGGTKAKYIENDIMLYNNNITSSSCIITDTEKTLTFSLIDGYDYILEGA